MTIYISILILLMTSDWNMVIYNKASKEINRSAILTFNPI